MFILKILEIIKILFVSLLMRFITTFRPSWLSTMVLLTSFLELSECHRFLFGIGLILNFSESLFKEITHLNHCHLKHCHSQHRHLKQKTHLKKFQ